MPLWEYCKINLNALIHKGDDLDLLNQAGQQGWELVNVAANNFAYFKRRVPEHARVE